MSRRKKGKVIKKTVWQSNTSLWAGKSYRDTLLPKHFILSLFFHVIFLIVFVNFAKNYLANHVQPITKNIEFILPKSHRILSPAPPAPHPETTQQSTIAEAPSPANTSSKKQQQSAQQHNTPKLPFFKKTTPQPSSASQTNENPDSDFLIPMSKIKRSTSSSSGFSKALSGTNSGSSDEASGSGNASGSSQSGMKGSKEIAGYDISPYINELRRNIKMNWKIPPNSSGKRVELFLRIAKDGRIMIFNVKTTSELADLDESTLTAVRRSSPLHPLPSKYGRNYLDVVFVFNASDGSVR